MTKITMRDVLNILTENYLNSQGFKGPLTQNTIPQHQNYINNNIIINDTSI
jgi:hypothetical protein